MAHPNPSRRRAVSLTLLAALLLAASAAAQSGRKAQKPLGLPTEAPKAADPAAAKPESKKPEPLVSLVVMRDDMTAGVVDPLARDGVGAAFVRRLGLSSAVEIKEGGRGGRSEARDAAKKQEKSYVVVLQLDEQAGDMSMGRANSRTLVIRTYVYTPKTGDLKFTDTVYQRPYYGTPTVGGIPVPVRTPRVDRYPSQHELEQAARDAADRLLSRFKIGAPQDNE